MKTVDKKFQQVFKAYLLVLLMSAGVISQAQETNYDISGYIFLPDNYKLSSEDEVHLFLLTEKTFKRI